MPNARCVPVIVTSHRQRVFGPGGSDWEWPFIEAVAAFNFLFAVWLIVKPGGDEALVWFDDIALALAPAFAFCMAALVAARHWGTRTGYAWALISFGLFMIATGEVAWGVQELGIGGEVPFPSAADVGYLGVYPPVFLGLLLMPHAPVNGIKRARIVLDTLIAISAIALISWHLILADLISESTDNVLAKGISLAYPFADLGIVFAALVVIGRSGRVTSGLAMACLASGFVAMACSDSLYTYLTSVNDYASGSYIDFGWIVAYSFIAIAALIVLTSRVSFERGGPGALEETPAIWPSLVVYAPLVPLVVVHMMTLASEEQNILLIEGGILAVFALVIARQILTIYENVHLNRGLAQRADELSQKLMMQKLERMLDREPAFRHLREAAAAEGLAPPDEVHVGVDERVTPDPRRLGFPEWHSRHQFGGHKFRRPARLFRPSLEDLAQEELGTFVAGVVEELRRRALFDDDAFVDEHHAVRYLAREAHLVGDHNHGHSLPRQRLHHLQHLAHQLRVQCRRWLVEEHHVGLHGEGAGNSHALLLAPRKLRGISIELVAQAHLDQHGPACFLGLFSPQLTHVDGRIDDVTQSREVRE